MLKLIVLSQLLYTPSNFLFDDSLDIFQTYSECELRDHGTIMECYSFDNRSDDIFFTVCTIDSHGTQCIDYYL